MKNLTEDQRIEQNALMLLNHATEGIKWVIENQDYIEKNFIKKLSKEEKSFWNVEKLINWYSFSEGLTIAWLFGKIDPSWYKIMNLLLERGVYKEEELDHKVRLLKIVKEWKKEL